MNFFYPRALCAKFGQIFPDIYQSISDKKRSIELSGQVNINRRCFKQLRSMHHRLIDYLAFFAVSAVFQSFKVDPVLLKDDIKSIAFQEIF